MTTRWLTTSDVAEMLGGKSVHEVRRWSFDQSTGKALPLGYIPAYKFGRQWRYDPVQIDAMVRGGSPAPRRPITTRPRKRAS